MSILQLRKVDKSYLQGAVERAVLAQLDLEVERGEQISIVGRSGSGKSTLLNLMCGIDEPDRGQVSLSGQELQSMHDAQKTRLRRREVGFVFQSFNLIATLRVREQLLLPLELNGISDRTRVHELLARVGLEQRAEAYPDQLSGGEQQRVAVARALIHEPSLLLADEPTGNLDNESSDVVLDLLFELSSSRDCALVLVTHNETAARRASRVLSLEGGRLIEAQNG